MSTDRENMSDVAGEDDDEFYSFSSNTSMRCPRDGSAHRSAASASDAASENAVLARNIDQLHQSLQHHDPWQRGDDDCLYCDCDNSDSLQPQPLQSYRDVPQSESAAGNGFGDRDGDSVANMVLEESPSEYRQGGYHPIAVGDIFKKRYRALHKLGWGHFSTVWLCFDTETERYCALKVVKSADHFAETALDEVRLLQAVESASWHPLRSRCVELMDSFPFSGPNGTHQCIVFEVLGDNLLTLIHRSRYKGLPLDNVKQIARQVLEGLTFLHTQCGIIHTDLKPENVLVIADDIAVRTQASLVAKQYLERHAHLYDQSKPAGKPSGRPGSIAAEPAFSQGDRDHYSDTKLTKTAKKRLRARIKRGVSFFQAHREWLCRRGFEDLLVLASHGLLTPSMAADAVTGKLPFLPLEQHELNILNDDDLAQLELLNVFDQVGDMPAKARAQHSLEQRSVSGIARIGQLSRSHRRSATYPNRVDKQGRYRRKRPRAAGGGNNNDDDATDSNLAKQHICKPLESSKEMIKLLVRSPENFIRYALQQLDRVQTQCSPQKRLSAKNKKMHSQKHGSKRSTPRSQAAKQEAQANLNLISRKDPATEPCNVRVKIADMGNACWFHHHFTDDIQTREYRSVEVILGAGYDNSADVWSAACLFWELATGDYLFDPNIVRDNASPDEAHIANIIETCGSIPKEVIEIGEYSPTLFDPNGELHHIKLLQERCLVSTLVFQYGWLAQDAHEFVDFLMPMLDTNPCRRIKAYRAMRHSWLYPAEDGMPSGSKEKN